MYKLFWIPLVGEFIKPTKKVLIGTYRLKDDIKEKVYNIIKSDPKKYGSKKGRFYHNEVGTSIYTEVR